MSSLSEDKIREYFIKIKDLVKADALYQKSDEKIKEFNKIFMGYIIKVK